MVKLLVEEYFYLNLLGKGISSIQNTVYLDGFPFLESAEQNLVLRY